MYVIKFDNDFYWCKYNTADKQLRKATIYNSLKMAKDVAEDCLTRIDRIQPYPLMCSVKSYTIIKVEIKEVGEVE